MRALSDGHAQIQAATGTDCGPRRTSGRSSTSAWIANVLVPGAGLVVRDRAAAGMLLAAMFTVGGVGACWGWWIVPLSIPPWLRGCGVGAALAAWVTAQVLLMRGSPRPGADPPAAADEDPTDASRE